MNHGQELRDIKSFYEEHNREQPDYGKTSPVKSSLPAYFFWGRFHATVGNDGQPQGISDDAAIALFTFDLMNWAFEVVHTLKCGHIVINKELPNREALVGKVYFYDNAVEDMGSYNISGEYPHRAYMSVIRQYTCRMREDHRVFLSVDVSEGTPEIKAWGNDDAQR